MIIIVAPGYFPILANNRAFSPRLLTRWRPNGRITDRYPNLRIASLEGGHQRKQEDLGRSTCRTRR